MLKNTLIIFVSLCIFYAGFAQKAMVTRQSAKQFEPESKYFVWIDPQTDTTNFEFVASIQYTHNGINAPISELYEAVADKANSMGANAYRLNEFVFDTVKLVTSLTLDTYYAIDSILKINYETHQTNEVYIIGGDVLSDSSSTRFKLGGQKISLKDGTFMRIRLSPGQVVSFNKGGFFGVSGSFRWKENKPAQFYSFSGFGVAGAGYNPAGGIGVTFSTGKIIPVDYNLGWLLIQVLKPSE
jgi:hypothetical protein